MKKVINLEEILKMYVKIEMDDNIHNTEKEQVLAAMQEACEQVLKLASENATGYIYNDFVANKQEARVSKYSIIGTIEQVV